MKKNKKINSLFILGLMLTLFSQNTYASNSIVETYTWDESTNLKSYYDYNDLEENALKETINSFEELENNNNEIMRAESRRFLYYDQKSKVTDYKAKYIGSARVDNRNNTQPSTITFSATNSGTWTVGSSVNLSGKTEINAVVAKVDATVSIGGTVSRSWSSGRTYGTSSVVPARKIGKLEAYMTGTYSGGDLVYDVYDSYGGTTYIGRYPIGTVVPSKNDWNFVYTVE